MATAVFGNAIGWAQFRILGGWKNIGGTLVAYMLALGTVMFALARLTSNPASITYAYFVGIYMGLQVLVLLVYGSMRVAGAVRSDVSSGVIESHRLMPVSPTSAVLGYLFGSTFQAMTLFVANFLLGVIAVSGARMSMQAWVVCNGVLLWFGLCVWTVMLFFSFRSPFGSMGWIFVIIAGYFFAADGGRLLPLPAGQVLFSPLIGHTIFDMRSGVGGIDKAYLVAGVAQLAIGWLYCVAAAKRYQRDDLTGVGPIHALLLLAVIAGVSVIGIRHFGWFFTFVRWGGGYDREAAFELSVILVLLVAILPISSAVRLSLLPPAGADPRQFPPAIAVTGAFAISMLLLLAPPAYTTDARIVRMAVTTFAFLVGTRYLLGIIYRLKLWPRRTMVLWLALTWFVPVVLETVRVSWVPDPTTEHVSELAYVSPPAEIYQNWSHDPLVHSDRFEGLAAQCGIAAMLGLLYAYVSRRQRRQSVMPPSIRA